MLNPVYFLAVLFVKLFKESFGFRVSGLGLRGKARENRAMRNSVHSLSLTPPTSQLTAPPGQEPCPLHSLSLGLRWIEFQALPGPEARALRAKTMRRASFPGPGGQFKCGMWSAECGMARTETKNSEFPIPNSEFGGDRWARLALRRHGGVSEWNSFPADAFCAQRPCFRATSLPLPRKENR